LHGDVRDVGGPDLVGAGHVGRAIENPNMPNACF
jgi:hypothetical protein